MYVAANSGDLFVEGRFDHLVVKNVSESVPPRKLSFLKHNGSFRYC